MGETRNVGSKTVKEDRRYICSLEDDIETVVKTIGCEDVN
jgi:hypothetical protein